MLRSTAIQTQTNKCDCKLRWSSYRTNGYFFSYATGTTLRHMQVSTRSLQLRVQLSSSSQAHLADTDSRLARECASGGSLRLRRGKIRHGLEVHHDYLGIQASLQRSLLRPPAAGRLASLSPRRQRTLVPLASLACFCRAQCRTVDNSSLAGHGRR